MKELKLPLLYLQSGKLNSVKLNLLKYSLSKQIDSLNNSCVNGLYMELSPPDAMDLLSDYTTKDDIQLNALEPDDIIDVINQNSSEIMEEVRNTYGVTNPSKAMGMFIYFTLCILDNDDVAIYASLKPIGLGKEILSTIRAGKCINGSLFTMRFLMEADKIQIITWDYTNIPLTNNITKLDEYLVDTVSLENLHLFINDSVTLRPI